MASSDSSDDEYLERLKEAADYQFINDSMFNKSKKSEKETRNETEEVRLPSLRPSQDEIDPQMNPFHVTPEFQKHVSQRLSALLDKEIEYTESDTTKTKKKRKKAKPTVRLLKDSEVFLDDKPNSDNLSSEQEKLNASNRKRPNIRRRKLETDNDLNGTDKFKCVAVSPEDILCKKDIQNWSNRSKAPVFKYKKSKSGKLELVEDTFK